MLAKEEESIHAVGFSGTHAGMPFEGIFSEWHATLQIDTSELSSSNIAATIAVASATDGVALHDSTLPEAEWFDVETFPQASYQAHHIEQREDGRFKLKGTLVIKGYEVEVDSLILSINGEQAIIDGQVSVNRTDINMGMESDPDGTWVSMDIGISVHLVANKR